jgi:hypothetical protein
MHHLDHASQLLVHSWVFGRPSFINMITIVLGMGSSLNLAGNHIISIYSYP